MKTEDKSQNWTKPDKDSNIHVPEELKPLFNKLGTQLEFYNIKVKNEVQTLADMTFIADEFYSEKINAIDEIVSEKINTQEEIIKDLTETNNKFHSRINHDREIKDLLRNQVKGLLDGLNEIIEASEGEGVLNDICVKNFVKELYEKYKQ
jgi:hypothetical protein